MTKKKPKAVKAWGLVTARGDLLLYHGSRFPDLYERRKDAIEKAFNGRQVVRVTITVDK